MEQKENWCGEFAFAEFIRKAGCRFDSDTLAMIKDCFYNYYGTEDWRGIIEWLLHVLFGK
jgi:hypothetical protein